VEDGDRSACVPDGGMTTSASRSFSPEAYVELVSGLLGQGYVLRGFADADPDRRHLILRHDVDFCLETAAEMAALEARHGLTATYFVLLRSEFYNVASPAARAALRRIADAGHDLGLHFDAELHGGKGRADLDAAAAEERVLLERFVGRAIHAVSYHRPGPHGLGGTERIGGCLNAYGPRFTQAMGYCSDSKGAWHHGSPSEHPAIKAGRALQLLTHPIWWMGTKRSPTTRLSDYLRNRLAFLDHELARHCAVHRPR
jgi:hypothetical protein